MCLKCNNDTYGPGCFRPIRPMTPHMDGWDELMKELTKMNQTTQFAEVEHKYAADHVHVADFIEWVNANVVGPKRVTVAGTDIYYRQGENVIRHRFPTSGPGELTVKVRKDEKTTTNRVEVDLPLAPTATAEVVERFLHFSGWRPEVTLFKTCNIYEFSHPENQQVAMISSASSKPAISLVIYDIHHIPAEGQVAKKHRRFIEVEVEKSAGISQQQALVALAQWDSKLRTAFKLDEPMTESLYELYTNGRYRVESNVKLWRAKCERCGVECDVAWNPAAEVLLCKAFPLDGYSTRPCGGKLIEVK